MNQYHSRLPVQRWLCNWTNVNVELSPGHRGVKYIKTEVKSQFCDCGSIVFKNCKVKNIIIIIYHENTK